jgi:hypothetical protein
LNSSLYIKSLRRSFLSILRVFKRGLIIIDLSAVLYSVLAVFLMILRSEAIEGMSFSSYTILDTGVRLDLYWIMLEERLYRAVHLKKKNYTKTVKS